MRVFPQLSTGAMAQFPFEPEIAFRTVVNSPANDSEVTYSDPDFEERAWLLRPRELSDAEWQQIETLFDDGGGLYDTFLFLEPGANLLAWSESSGQTAWVKSSGAATTDGIADPGGGSGGISASGPGGAILGQTLTIPAGFRYAASVWARTAAGGAKLRVTDGVGLQSEAAIGSDNVWRRYEALFPGGSVEEILRFELEVGGATLEVFGPQLEAQASPSAYKRTTARGGVFPAARFDQESLGDRLTGQGRHSGALRIVWTPSQT